MGANRARHSQGKGGAIVNRAYKQRIAQSKARLDADMRATVAANKGLPFDEMRELVNRRCHTAIDPDYLRELMRYP